MQKDTRFFDTRAEHWEETCYPPPVRERLLKLIEAFGITPEERVLDVGTGPGVLLPYLRDRVGPSGRLCAFDLSMQMLRQARQKPRAAQDTVLQADAHHIPFRDEMFDRVICFAAFPHFQDPRYALQEMSRVLNPGGHLIIAHLMSRKELAAHHASHASVATDVLPEHDHMKMLFVDARLSASDIVDRPGRYLARGVKKQ